MSEEVIIRNAREEDIPRLIEVEQTAWKDEGTEVYGREHFEAWLELYPEGFFVGEENGVIVGFTYTEAVFFDPSDMSIFTTFDDITDHGFSRRTHNSTGNYHFGITICSTSRGVGKVLLQALLDFSNQVRKPLLGFSRIKGFAEYFDSVSPLPGFEIMTKELEDKIALSYALECAKMTEARIWEGLSNTESLAGLPQITAPDPILRFYLKNKEFMLYGILPDFIQDPKSRNYSVLFGQRLK